MPIPTILVPRGAEFQAVCRGLRRGAASPKVVAIPMGVASVRAFLSTYRQQHCITADAQFLVMGLCGSLQPLYQVGDAVLYTSSMTLSAGQTRAWTCSPEWTDRVRNQLAQGKAQPSLVKAWTSDQFIQSVQRKQQLGATYGVDVVDMEGTAILEQLADTGAQVAMLRVVSDDCLHELPDLSPAISPTGKLRPLPLTQILLQNPRGALRLIQGAQRGLTVLQSLTQTLFAPPTELLKL